jgi:hypothetical protein
MALLDNAENFRGPLSPEIKSRIMAYMENPSAEAWDGVYGIIVAESVRAGTLWQGVIAVDPDFPGMADGNNAAERWPVYPDSVTLARAIRALTG